MDHSAAFASAMIRALLARLKRKTRRHAYRQVYTTRTKDPGLITMPTKWVGMRPRDHVWVREGFYTVGGAFGGYKTDGRPHSLPRQVVRLHPATHMPPNLSRITLIVEEVRVEPLQSISEADAEAEGVSFALEEVDKKPWGDISPAGRRDMVNEKFGSHRMAFEWMWNRFYGRDAWKENPAVAVITFVPYEFKIDEAPSSLAAE